MIFIFIFTVLSQNLLLLVIVTSGEKFCDKPKRKIIMNNSTKCYLDSKNSFHSFNEK